MIKMRRKIAASGGARVLGMGGRFILTFTVARLFGAEGTGLFYMMLGVVFIAGLLGRLGIDSVVLYRASSPGRETEEDRLNIGHALTLVAIASMLATLAVVGLAHVLGEHVFGSSDLVPVLLVGALSIIPTNILHVRAEVMKARGLHSLGVFVQSGGTHLVAAGLLLIPFFSTMGVLGASSSFVIASWAALVLVIISHQPRHRGDRPVRRLRSTAIGLLRESWPLLLATSAYLILTWTDVLMLGAFEGPSETGIYTIAARVAGLLGVILFGMEAVLLPALGRVGATHISVPAAREAVRQAARFVTILALPAAIVLMVWPGPVLSVFGDAFPAGQTVLRILIVAQIVTVTTGTARAILITSGNGRDLQRASLVAAGANLVLNATLIPLWGAIGAATATAISLILLQALSAWAGFQRTGIWPWSRHSALS